METFMPPEIWKGDSMIDIDIQKSFRDFSISLKFTTSKNRCVIFGPSGSGKSSLLKMIAGFYNPDFGTIKIKNKLFFSHKEKINLPIQLRNIGYLPQEYTLFPNMTVKENIKYGLKRRKTQKFMDITELAERFNISNCLEKYPYEISGGQKQRVALARALIVKPDILLLDEPFSALDKPIREELRELVADVADSFSISVLFVTHDLEEAFVFGKDMVIIKDGNVVEFGDKDRLFNKPTFIESARLMDFGNIWKIKTIHKGYIKLENSMRLTTTSAHQTASFCCIKPENVMILRDDVDISDKENKIKVKIKKINFRGRYVKIATETENRIPIHINIPPHILPKMSLKEGKTVTVSLKKDSIILCKKVDL